MKSSRPAPPAQIAAHQRQHHTARSPIPPATLQQLHADMEKLDQADEANAPTGTKPPRKKKSP
jgi:hypothetical protein